MTMASTLIVAIVSVVLFLPSISEGVLPRKSKDIIDAPLLTSKIATNRSIIVGPSEEFKTVQAAIDAVPDGNFDWIIIHLRAGIYREKVVIPKNKEYIFLRGNGRGRTAIVWDDSSTNNTLSTTFTVWANNFVAFGISFKNDASVGVADTFYNQSVAVMVVGDEVAFYHCAFYSPHNTLFDYKGRHYYESCYIQGNIDFIFGRGQSIFQSCEIFVLHDKRKKILGSITAQNRQSLDDTSGFVFLNGKVYGVGDVFLGRAKGEYSRVIFAKTYLSRTITPAGWTNWSYDGLTDNLLYGEYECHGPGSEPGSRVPWSKQLSEEEASPFITIDFINGKEWLPAYY
ncbi:putative pectinesterase 67 isoform X1 [Canna indica]|uniref:pectinesterase n=1 Tax=Canna indica TaxID=4628 RepID=A0AAQ3JRQ2_9LILI|nr:putative pectinesterase 67 isoform X1 [Canna indica]